MSTNNHTNPNNQANQANQKNQGSDMVPELRFPEFSGRWKTDKLGKVARFSKGKGISKSEVSENGSTPCIRYGELYTRYNELIDQVISKTDLPLKDLVLSEENDVIIPASGETQIDIATASCVLNTGVALGGDLNIIRSSLNGIFLSYLLNNKKRTDIAALAQGISVVHLYASQLKELQISTPSLPEQTKIAEFLTAVDKRIELLACKKKQLEQYKKGVMQQIFPSAAGQAPQIRFKDEDGKEFPEWEEKRLGDVATFRRGSFPQPYGLPKWYDEEKGMPFVQVYDVDENFRLKAITKQKISALAAPKSVFVNKGSIVLTIQGSIGRIAITQYDAYVDRTLLIFQSFKEKMDKLFFTYIVYLLFEIEKERAVGGTIKTITKEKLSDFKIKLPSYPEQQKIADFLSAIDKKIEQVGRQLDHNRQWKKGLLQKMFV